MQAIGREPHPAPDGTLVHYERHRPEQTTQYRLVQWRAATFNLHGHTPGPDALQRQGMALVLVLANVNEQQAGLMRRSGFEAELGEGRAVVWATVRLQGAASAPSD